MKIYNPFYRVLFSIKIVALTIFLIISSSCSKDDNPAKEELAKSSEKEVLSFSFLAANNSALATNVIGNINKANKTITVNLPSDTPQTALKPTISISPKASIDLQGTQNFTTPITYKVTAEDNSSDNYSVTATSYSSAKQITSFVFLVADNPFVTDLEATIDEENKTIDVTVPPDVDVTSLLPEIKISEKATINLTSTQNFTEPILYDITAEDGSMATYTATVHFPITQLQILQTILDANPGNTIEWDLNNTTDIGILDGVITNMSDEIIELSLSQKNLSGLPSEIGQLKLLERLVLFDNALSEIPIEIGDLDNLMYLQLGTNQLQVLPAEIGRLTKLEILILTENQISSIPVEFSQLSSLTNLVLRSNRLITLPTELSALNSLNILDLSHNQFSEFPMVLESMPNLKALYLENNQLTEIQQEIAGLISLNILNLSNNEISFITPEIGKLTLLKNLYLYNNQLTSLPLEIGKLTLLEDLFLINNQLIELPPEIGFLIKLKRLDITDNNLIEIPQAIFNLSELKYGILNLSSDNTVNVSISSQNDALISIYSANPGNTLDWGVNNFSEVGFNTNGDPVSITANNKNLTRIPSEIRALTELESININSNNLSSLPNSLGDLDNLSIITAASNQISTVPAELAQLNNLALLSLTQNPITSIPQVVCNRRTSNGGILTILTDPGEGCN